MQIFVQAGHSLRYFNETGALIESGAVVAAGAVVGVAATDIPDNGSASFSVEGVFEVPKAAGTSWDEGAPLACDSSQSAFTTDATLSPASGDVRRCAFAAAQATSSAAVGRVKLANPGTPVS